MKEGLGVANMTDTNSVNELLVHWQELRRQGRTVSPRRIVRRLPPIARGAETSP
jgi:hypothetical protein